MWLLACGTAAAAVPRGGCSARCCSRHAPHNKALGPMPLPLCARARDAVPRCSCAVHPGPQPAIQPSIQPSSHPTSQPVHTLVEDELRLAGCLAAPVVRRHLGAARVGEGRQAARVVGHSSGHHLQCGVARLAGGALEQVVIRTHSGVSSTRATLSINGIQCPKCRHFAAVMTTHAPLTPPLPHLLAAPQLARLHDGRRLQLHVLGALAGGATLSTCAQAWAACVQPCACEPRLTRGTRTARQGKRQRQPPQQRVCGYFFVFF